MKKKILATLLLTTVLATPLCASPLSEEFEVNIRVKSIPRTESTDLTPIQPPSKPPSGDGGGTVSPPDNIDTIVAPPNTVISGGKDEDGNNLIMSDGLYVNKVALDEGYVVGYEDEEFKADKGVSRAEVSAMFSRILSDRSEPKNKSNLSTYKDLDESHWAYDDIREMNSYGIINGYEDGSLKPDAEITRAELSCMINRVLNLIDYSDTSDFLDIENHYAKEDISRSNDADVVKGYEDKTFRPNNEISRAETVCMINRVFGLNLEDTNKDGIYRDISGNEWYGKEVLKASKDKIK